MGKCGKAASQGETEYSLQFLTCPSLALFNSVLITYKLVTDKLISCYSSPTSVRFAWRCCCISQLRKKRVGALYFMGERGMKCSYKYTFAEGKKKLDIYNCCSFDGNSLVEMCWKKLWNSLGVAAGFAGLLDWIFLGINGHRDASGDIWKGPIGSWPYSVPGHNKTEAQIKNPTLEIFFSS